MVLLGLALELTSLGLSGTKWLVTSGYYGGRYLLYGPQKDPILEKLEELEKKIGGPQTEEEILAVDELVPNSWWVIHGEHKTMVANQEEAFQLLAKLSEGKKNGQEEAEEKKAEEKKVEEKKVEEKKAEEKKMEKKVLELRYVNEQNLVKIWHF